MRLSQLLQFQSLVGEVVGHSLRAYIYQDIFGGIECKKTGHVFKVLLPRATEGGVDMPKGCWVGARFLRGQSWLSSVGVTTRKDARYVFIAEHAPKYIPYQSITVGRHHTFMQGDALP